jgi:outer membrane protein assembly factor BamB
MTGRVILCAVLMLMAVGPVSGEEWRGFRGLEQQGVGAAQQGPIEWSPTRNVLWKVGVRGGGHSSPVVTADRVFVTTAYEADTTKLWLSAARRLRLFLCLAALALWFVLPAHGSRWQQFLAGCGIALFVLLALADEQVLQFARSSARAWLGAALALMTGLFVSAYGLERSAPVRRMVGAALVVLAVVLVAGMPVRLDESRVLTIALAAIAAGALAAGVLVLFGVFAARPFARSLSPAFVAIAVIAGSVILQPYAGRWTAVLPMLAVLIGLAIRTFAGTTRPALGAWRACTIAAAIVGFTTTTVLLPRSGLAHAIASLDRASGKVLWVREGLWAPRAAVHSTNSQATPTAVTDGERVFAYFGTPGLMAVRADGTLLWTNSTVPFDGMYGVGASPVLAYNTLILSSVTSDGPYLAAFDAESGRELWRKARVAVAPDDSRTPLVVTIDGRRTVIVWGSDDIAAHDLATGTVLWKHPHNVKQRVDAMVPSALAAGDRLYLPLHNGMTAMSLSALAHGKDAVLWESRGGASGLSTPVLYQDRIYAVSAAGIASSVDASTGRLVWRSRLHGEYYSSPIAMGGNIYFTNDAGVTTVVAAADTYQALATNEIGEPVSATIAPVDGHLYVRSHQHLYRISAGN